MKRTPELPRVMHDLIRLRGGLDLITPTLDLKPGFVRDAVNFEISNTGGYRRIDGYDRFDGQFNPSDAIYSTIVLDDVGTINVTDEINGETSGATGKVFLVNVTTKEVFFTMATGTFLAGENCRKVAVVQGVVQSLGELTPTARQTALYTVFASIFYRALIQPVPGSGPVRGVSYYQDTVYAWRDNAGGTAMDIYKSSGAGWVAVGLGHALEFTGATGQIFDGDNIVGLTSGATGTVSRAVLRSGTWSSAGAGTLILSATTGTFVLGENIQVSAVTKAVAGGAAAAQTLLPGGRVDTDIGSLSGGGGAKMYGSDGVNPAFEFDGTSYVKIRTGMATDAPLRVKLHRNYLFLTFGTSLQHSALGNPYSWSPVLGAGELGLNSPITALSVLPGSTNTAAMAIYSRNATAILYGTSASDWLLTNFVDTTGALAYTEQNLSDSYVLDDRGIIQLRASQDYGNFTDATLTSNIRSFIQSRRNNATASMINREKSQYRVFFSDGYGLHLTIVNGKLLGSMPVLFPNPVTCAVSGENPNGNETGFFGSTDGYVYRSDTGPNFAGTDISASLFFNFATQGDSRVSKHYRRGVLEIQGSSYAELSIGYDLAYSDSSIVDQQPGALYTASFSAPFWDSFTWDDFIWDGRALGPSEIEIQGSAENIALRIDCNGATFSSFTINSLILHYTPRRGLR